MTPMHTSVQHISQSVQVISSSSSTSSPSVALKRNVDGLENFLTSGDHSGPLALLRSPRMLHLLKIAITVANTDAPILIEGETGTGKDVLAHFVHRHSTRSTGPLVLINCAAIPETLFEGEVFGFERGSFTGALNTTPGKFELASAGTLVLDEITDLPISLQAKLLRVIESQALYRIGGTRPIPVNPRIIAISNRPVWKSVTNKRFRSDLYFRLSTVVLNVPPLRERKEDILPIATYYCEIFSHKYNKSPMTLSDDAKTVLLDYDWPGNIRQLRNIIHRAVLFSQSATIFAHNLTGFEHSAVELDSNDDLNLEKLEKKAILMALRSTKGNKTRAAKLLGITTKTLYNKIKTYSICLQDAAPP